MAAYTDTDTDTDTDTGAIDTQSALKRQFKPYDKHNHVSIRL